jgi:HSP20 family protein
MPNGQVSRAAIPEALSDDSGVWKKEANVMANVTIQRVEDDKPALAPDLEETRTTFDKIRKRAFELFERRGGAPGFNLDDWVRAEHDLFWVPQAELAETEAEFQIKVGVPGFEARDLDIKAHPTEILVQGNTEKRQDKTEAGMSYSEFGMKPLYRRFSFTTTVDVGAVTANVENGLLTVSAPKKKEEAKVETKETENRIAAAA